LYAEYNGNREACGLCDPTCRKEQLTDASGKITAVSGDRLRAGETFSLSDGINPPKIFEFDDDEFGDVEPGRIPIFVGDEMEAMDVARAIKRAIKNTIELSIDADVSTGSSIVTLKNIKKDPRAGAFGNQRIIETVRDPGFIVEGMSGGGANDCPGGPPCTLHNDCASGYCTAGVCLP
jgi:hypothetical protein